MTQQGEKHIPGTNLMIEQFVFGNCGIQKTVEFPQFPKNRSKKPWKISASQSDQT